VGLAVSFVGLNDALPQGRAGSPLPAAARSGGRVKPQPKGTATDFTDDTDNDFSIREIREIRGASSFEKGRSWPRVAHSSHMTNTVPGRARFRRPAGHIFRHFSIADLSKLKQSIP
jgi:hypothetical protein